MNKVAMMERYNFTEEEIQRAKEERERELQQCIKYTIVAYKPSDQGEIEIDRFNIPRHMVLDWHRYSHWDDVEWERLENVMKWFFQKTEEGRCK